MDADAEGVYGGGRLNEFPERLRKLRERNRLKRCALSECCGLDRNAIGRLERGEIEPTRRTLEGLADRFDVSVDYLLGRTDWPNSPPKKF